MSEDYIAVLKLIKRREPNFYLQLNIQHNKTVFQQESLWDLEIFRMYEGQDEFEQLTLRDFKMQSFSTLKSFNNCSLITADNSDNIRIWIWYWCLCC